MKMTIVPTRLQPPSSHGRTPGIHVSKVIRAIAVTNGVLKPEYAEDLSLEEVPAQTTEWWNNLPVHAQLRMAIGLAWEQWYIPQLPEVVDHPGEMVCDGIYLTHDGESIDILWGDTFAIHEVKATYKSLNTVAQLQTQWMWIAQAKSYAKAAGCNVVYLHVLFICGDYTYPITPLLRVWKLEFTDAEIDENWDVIIGYVRHRQQAEQESQDE